MCRELFEEVGLTALEWRLLESKYYTYPDKTLYLHFYLVTQFSGSAQCREGQPLRRVSRSQLALYDFPEANMSIIELL